MITHFTIIAEIEAAQFFEDDSINLLFCKDHATFEHKEGCEFILHCGENEDGEFVKNTVAAMTEYGCTTDFIEVYQGAARQGAVRVLFYV